ncbi:TonB-dependent receptor [Flavitalea antarctica]
MDFKFLKCRYARCFAKTMLIMNLTAIFVFFIGFQVFAGDGHAQNVSVNMKNTTLKKFFKAVQKQTGYNFLYSTELLDRTGRVDVVVQNVNIEEALEKCLQNTSLTYTIVEKTIIIKGKKATLHSPENPPLPPPITVSGKVVDEEGKALQDVSVVLKSTGKGVVTDKEGQFTIQVPEGGGVLVFSYVGFQNFEIRALEAKPLSISLKKKDNSAEEVIVIGYGTAKKSDITGAVSSVSPDKYADQTITRVDQVLQGRAAGVVVSNTVGAPGADVSVRIRGANSALGSNEPLYVVDGYIGADYNLINPNDIATLEVLKDASSTAIYGSRGSNGVIIITTKAGKKGKVKVNYQGQFYQSEVIRKYDVLSAADFATVVNQRNAAIGLNPAFNNEQIKTFQQNGGSLWQDEIYRTAPGTDHQLSVSGASDKSSFLISGSYVDQKGVVQNSGFNRFSIRSNMTTQVTDKLSFRLNIFGARSSNLNTQIRTGSTNNPIVQSLSWAPTTPVYDVNGSYTLNDPTSSNKYNPLALVYDQENILEKSNVNTVGGLKYEFIKGLSLNVQFVIDYLSLVGKTFNGSSITNGIPTASKSNSRRITTQTTNSLSYERTFNTIHRINAVAVFETQVFKDDFFNASATGLKFPELKYDNLGQANAFTAGSGFTKWSLLSLLGRVNYSLMDRYLLSISVRRDGSSKFRGDNRYSTFPAVALGWNVANESFIKDLNVFSALKLRASWGQTGSQAINPYATESGYNTSSLYAFNSSTLTSAIQLGNPGNKDLKWETTTQKDIGIEIGLLGDRLNVEFDYFVKNTTDLLLNRPLPIYTGGGELASNLGEIKNEGWELSIGATIIKTNNFRWKSDFVISDVKNTVVSLGGVAPRIFSSPNVSGIATAPEFVYEPGQPLGSLWGLRYLGTWKPSEAAEAAKFGNIPGDARYQDLNGNKLIGAEDYQIIGNGLPEMALGFNNTVTYKNFSVNFFFQGVFGADKLNYSRGAALMADRDTRQAILEEIKGRYIPGENETSEFPAFSKTNKIQPQSTLFLEKGDFIRLKNLSFTYKFPQTLIPGISDFKLFVRATNLVTFTNYKGIDPETNSVGIATDLQQGIDYGSYPNAKTYTLGLSVTF